MSRRSAFFRRFSKLTRWLVPAVLLVAGGCKYPDAPKKHVPFTVRSKDFRAEQIPNRKVFGTLRGKKFFTQDARFRVEHMAGREHVDLYFADEPIMRCGLPLARHARRVWLRFGGVTHLGPGIYRVDRKDAHPVFTVHYELPAHPGWTAAQGGAALVVIDTVEPDVIQGRMRTCFDDGQGSCVEGRFHATSCVGELDVDNPVTGAGLLNPTRPPPPGGP